ncbi:helix-hairpin-helix domain-containing protein [Micromonospora vulcania]|uniref:Helix-hairpin-helix domain-containing protein n=1 Tax=Micromonospora vulcania TaxID=1441873 RepID=A0ABW1H536_9ACTN
MAWFINQSFLIILAAFLLGLLVGWLVWGNRKSSPPSTGDASADLLVADEDVVAPTRHSEAVLAHRVTAARDARTIESDQETRPVVVDDGARAVEARGPQPTPEGPAASVEPVVAEVVPAESRDDELERIEGIGPKMANALRAAGIRSFRQLAEADDSTRRAAIEAAGLTFAPSLVTWGRQAQLLADGDETGFAELTELLVAGRDTGRA